MKFTRLLLSLGACLWLGLTPLFGQLIPTLRLDYTQAEHQYRDFNDFFNSYNAYYGRNMAVPMDTLSATQFSHLNCNYLPTFVEILKMIIFMTR